MVFEKGQWAYADICWYLCQTVWNHATNSMKRLKQPTSVFLQRDVGHVRSSLLNTWRTRETKMHVSRKFQILWTIQGGTMAKGISRFQDLFKVPEYWDNPSPPLTLGSCSLLLASFASSCTPTCACPSLCGGTPRCRTFSHDSPCTPWTSLRGPASGSSRCHRQSSAHQLQRVGMQQGHLVMELKRASWKQRGCCFCISSVCQKLFSPTFLRSTREWHHIPFQNTRWEASRCSAPLQWRLDGGQLGCLRGIEGCSKSQVCCSSWKPRPQFSPAQWCIEQNSHSKEWPRSSWCCRGPVQLTNSVAFPPPYNRGICQQGKGPGSGGHSALHKQTSA